ncbi:DNA-directed RNA polymerase subunit B [Candidatus Woesearchaeota archaeon]|nr:MAG: DNA-directed RNA polymerase subunit B [Candidatus Woesearchaeota archaeon]
MVDVYLDEKFVGTVDNPKEFVKTVINERRNGRLPSCINIEYDKDYNEVYIHTKTGRARRPLIIVDNGVSRLTPELKEMVEKGKIGWKDLVNDHIIEYLDANEEENAYVALNEKKLTKEHTHLEISPVAMLGLLSSLVPYANFGQSSRLNRGSKTQKQSLGIYATNFHLRMDTDVSILHYPQKPMVKSFMHDVIRYDKHPAGQNVTVAVMSFDGYNMEDGIILNKGSVERGLARSTYFRPYGAEEIRYQGGLVDEIGIPDKEVKGYREENDYRFLEEDGIVYPEAQVNQEDVIIGKTSPPRFLGEIEEFSIAANTRRESSVVVKQGNKGVVDMVVVTENGEGNKLVQIRLRDQRVPEIGDKFASRHGQKGVIGMIVPQADMPFTASGIVPDLIFSPHSVPSRMTINYLIEVLAGKVGALAGRQIDGTTFSAEAESDLRKMLLELGFRENGTEMMYNGVTGEAFEAKIFVGNTYYMKLKHMVANKMHARSSGRIQLLTRQPIEGRSKGGGLRLGEMEKDCFIAHGASLLLKERFDSDKVKIPICEKCGMLAIRDNIKGTESCSRCGANIEVSTIEMSYAFKLLLDELKAIGINPTLSLKNKF